jgi:hypothetical protein
VWRSTTAVPSRSAAARYVGPGDASDGDDEPRRGKPRQGSGGHRLGHLGRDGADAMQQVGGDVEEVLLRDVRVAHDAAQEVVAGAGNLGDDVADHATRARLCAGHLPAALGQRPPEPASGSIELVVGGRSAHR